MYLELTKLGLENYIGTACGGSVQSNPYFNALERFVSSLSENNKKVLQSKFKRRKRGQTHPQTSDLLNEVAVACVFHPKANFSNSGPDLTENGVNIEVKTLNESDGERQRHQSNSFSAISPVLSTNDLSKERSLIERALGNKVACHLKKADEQLNREGCVYLIWDYNNLLHGEDGHVHGNTIVREPEVREIIRSAINDFVGKRQKITVRSYYFGELQKLVADPDTSAHSSKSL